MPTTRGDLVCYTVSISARYGGTGSLVPVLTSVLACLNNPL